MQNRHFSSNRRHSFHDKDKDKFRINENIQAREVRLIDEKGSVLGVFPTEKALTQARDAELDLVEISPTSEPPICKIFNYNKFIYQREKKRKEAKKHQKTVQLKEIKFRPQTDVHDYNFKVKHIKEFLENGDKVKITIRFKGRELAFKDLGYGKIEKITEDIKDVGKIEMPARMEGRTLFMTVGPLRVVTRDPKQVKTSTPTTATPKNPTKVKEREEKAPQKEIAAQKESETSNKKAVPPTPEKSASDTPKTPKKPVAKDPATKDITS